MKTTDNNRMERFRAARITRLVRPADGIGLVLAGGGGKGAYQIGVWRAMAESGIVKRITGISGASVGALNMLLMAQGDLKCALRIWKGATQEVLLDKKGLRALIDEAIRDWDCITSSGKNLFVNISRISPALRNDRPHRKLRRILTLPEYYCLSGLTREDITDLVLISASIPVLTGAPRLLGQAYTDGGVADRLPVRPLVEAGYRKIIVVHLDHDGSDEHAHFTNAVHGLDVRNVTFHHVYPGKRLTGKDFFTLTPEHSMALMKLGYLDAKLVFSDNAWHNG